MVMENSISSADAASTSDVDAAAASRDEASTSRVAAESANDREAAAARMCAETANIEQTAAARAKSGVGGSWWRKRMTGGGRESRYNDVVTKLDG